MNANIPKPTAASSVASPISPMRPTSSLQNPTTSDSAAATQSPTIETLYAKYARELLVSIRKTYGDGPPDPEDVTQQAFQKLMERGDLSSISNPMAFIWRIARNIVLGDKRSQTVRLRYDYEIEQLYFPLEHDDSTPERIIAVREQLALIAEVLRAMPERRRRAVILNRIEGLNVTEVGRRMGISRQSAAKQIARGLAELNVVFLHEGTRSAP